MQQFLSQYRTMFLFRGLAALAFGVITLVWPKLTLLVLVLLFGFFAVISGITTVGIALRSQEEHGWVLRLFEGMLGILAGAIALVWPGITALAFAFLLAAWAISTGILELILPLTFPMSVGGAVLLALAGLVSVIFGVLIAVQPAFGLLAVVWLIGSYAIVFGVLHLVAYFEARAATRARIPSIV